MSDKETIDGVLRELRGLLEKVLRCGLDAIEVGTNTTLREQLRALLDGQVAAYAHDGGNNQKGDGPAITGATTQGFHSSGDGGGCTFTFTPAAQAQGEPVAWIKEHWSGKSADFHYKTLVDVVFKDDWKPLYAEQPESVAINKPTTINYSALDAEDRLAVCRGECTKDEAAKNLLIKNLLRKVRATLHFTPEDVLAIDAVLRDDGK